MRIVGTEMDITKRKLAEQELQHLSARLLDSQDQERRRIARELHDGTAQNIPSGLDLRQIDALLSGTLQYAAERMAWRVA